MAWSEQWTIQVDGHDVNDLRTGGHWSCMVPEVGWLQEQSVMLVDRDGDYPAFVGMQPIAGNYTFLINSTACDWATWASRLAVLSSWFSPGLHTFTFQVRGMASAKSVNAVVRSLTTEDVSRRVTVLATAPTPVLT